MGADVSLAGKMFTPWVFVLRHRIHPMKGSIQGPVPADSAGQLQVLFARENARAVMQRNNPPAGIVIFLKPL